MAPALSITFNWNAYTPEAKLEIEVPIAELFAMVYDVGPAIFVQVYDEIVPFGSFDALPLTLTVLVGKVIFISEPAFATGG
jgi:hypothetical protein